MARPRLKATLRTRGRLGDPEQLTEDQLSFLAFDALFIDGHTPEGRRLNDHCMAALREYQLETPLESQTSRGELLVVVKAAQQFKAAEAAQE